MGVKGQVGRQGPAGGDSLVKNLEDAGKARDDPQVGLGLLIQVILGCGLEDHMLLQVSRGGWGGC